MQLNVDSLDWDHLPGRRHRAMYQEPSARNGRFGHSHPGGIHRPNESNHRGDGVSTRSTSQHSPRWSSRAPTSRHRPLCMNSFRQCARPDQQQPLVKRSPHQDCNPKSRHTSFWTSFTRIRPTWIRRGSGAVPAWRRSTGDDRRGRPGTTEPHIDSHVRRRLGRAHLQRSPLISDLDGEVS